MKKITAIALGIMLPVVCASADNFRTDLNKNERIISDDYASFSFSLIGQSIADSVHHKAQVTSKEFAIQVSGAELNRGVKLPISHGNAVVRITRQSGDKIAEDLDMTELTLDYQSKAGVSRHSAVATTISKNQLASAGVFENTVAIKTKAEAPKAPLVLQTKQALKSDDLYRVSVLEKDSPIALNIHSPKQSFQSNELIEFKANVEMNSKEIPFEVSQAFVLSPSGEKLPVQIQSNGISMAFSMNTPSKVISPIHGLYELHVSADSETKSTPVKRDAKIAFALSKPTATLKNIDSQGHDRAGATVNVAASEASRYEIRAVLMGTDQNGETKPIAEIHTAQSVNAGFNPITIKYDQGLIAKSGYSAPFSITNIRLYDQKQLALIDTH